MQYYHDKAIFLYCKHLSVMTSGPSHAAQARLPSLMVVFVVQNVVIEGQETPLRLSFAKDKPTDRPPAASTLASDALQVKPFSPIVQDNWHG